MLEIPNSSLTPIEHQEISLDDFLDKLKISKVQCQKINYLETKSRKFDNDEVFIYEDYFDNKITYESCTNQLNKTNQERNQYEIKLNPQENSEKEKILEY